MKSKFFAFAAALGFLVFSSAAYASQAKPRPILDMFFGILSSTWKSKTHTVANWTGYQIIENSQGIQMHRLSLDVDDKITCEEMNKAFYKGLLLDCPPVQSCFLLLVR